MAHVIDLRKAKIHWAGRHRKRCTSKVCRQKLRFWHAIVDQRDDGIVAEDRAGVICETCSKVEYTEPWRRSLMATKKKTQAKALPPKVKIKGKKPAKAKAPKNFKVTFEFDPRKLSEGALGLFMQVLDRMVNDKRGYNPPKEPAGESAPRGFHNPPPFGGVDEGPG
jgi:hypothetical protein